MSDEEEKKYTRNRWFVWFGKDFSEDPCFPKNFAQAFVIGTFVGMLRFLYTSRMPISSSFGLVVGGSILVATEVSCQYNRYKADKALEKAAMRGKKPSYGKLFGEGQSQTAVGATADGGLADH